VASNAAMVVVGKPSPEKVQPEYLSKKKDVSDETCLSEDDLEEKDGKVYLKKKTAERIACELLKVNEADTNILPFFKGTLTKQGYVMSVSFMIKGKGLLALFPDEISLIGLIKTNCNELSKGKLFEYVNSEDDFDDKKFTILLNGKIYEGELDPEQEYELMVFIKDGGEFDLDGKVNGSVIASIYLAREATGGDSCGCNAGLFNYGAFAVFVMALLVMRKR
jgi:hypothetical protein